MKQRLLKISEVAEASDTSLTTVKYYVREGLIRPAKKTSPNMAYYAPEAVEQVRLIRRLQGERFYPLSVIRRLLRQGDPGEAELLHAISKADQDDYYDLLPLSQAITAAGLDGETAALLEAAGLLSPQRRGEETCCCRGELRLMELVRRRQDAGIPAAQTVKIFSLYESHLRKTARQDIESLLNDCMLSPGLTTAQAVEIIHVSDQTLDDFIAMRRYALNAQVGNAFLERVERFLRQLENYARRLAPLLETAEDQKVLAAMLAGEETGQILPDAYGRLLRLRDQGIAQALSALNAALTAFRPPVSREASHPRLCALLRQGIAALAPRELRFSPSVSEPDRAAARLIDEIQRQTEKE